MLVSNQIYNQPVKYEGPINNLAIQIAMRHEAEPLIQRLGLVPYSAVERLPHLQLAKGQFGNLNIQVIVHGSDSRFGVERVGTEAATLAAFKLIELANPDLLINAGTAGGFNSKGGEIGDVYLSSGVVFHDHRFPWENYNYFGHGWFPVVAAPRLVNELQFKTGLVSTGNSFEPTEADITSFNLHNAALKDMEAAAVAQVAYDQNVPFLALKSVTDFVDQPCGPESFMQNLALASNNLSDKLLQLINKISEIRRLEYL